jgi:putative flavoprotein involved in K+ transport
VEGKNVLVIGSGNSGHDIAQDLHSAGAKVTLVQRSSTMIVNVEPSAQLQYALYDEGPSLEDCDLITTSMPLPLVRKSHIVLTETARNMDKELLEWARAPRLQARFRRRRQRLAVQVPHPRRRLLLQCRLFDLIIKGEIGLAQFSDIATFVPAGALMRTAKRFAADLIVLATGYKGQECLVANCSATMLPPRRPDLGIRRWTGIAQHVRAHRPTGPLVHRGQLRPMPHLLEISRPPD